MLELLWLIPLLTLTGAALKRLDVSGTPDEPLRKHGHVPCKPR